MRFCKIERSEEVLKKLNQECVMAEMRVTRKMLTLGVLGVSGAVCRLDVCGAIVCSCVVVVVVVEKCLLVGVYQWKVVEKEITG